MLNFKIFFYLFVLVVTETYAQDKIYNWVNGPRNRFSSAGHSKSLGLRFTIDYPQSWTSEEGKRPHIVKKFTGEYQGMQNAFFLVQIMPLDNSNNREEIVQAINNPSNFKYFLPSEASFIFAEKVRIDGLNGAFYSYKMSRTNDLVTVYMKSKSYNFLYKNWWIIIVCTASGNTEYEADNFYQKVNPLFSLIANSLVVLNQYER